jgi:hypothetical protein
MTAVDLVYTFSPSNRIMVLSVVFLGIWRLSSNESESGSDEGINRKPGESSSFLRNVTA